MLVKDEVAQERHNQTAQQEAQQERMRRLMLAEVAQEDEVTQFDAGNAEKQKGRQLWPHQLEAMLKKIIPGEDRVRFHIHPQHPELKCIWIKGPDGNHYYSGVYPNSLIPEHTIMEVVEERVADPDCTVIMADEAKRTQGWAGFKKVKKYRWPLVKGWRAVLLTLLWQGIVKLDDVERLFGYTDSEVWAAKAKGRADAKSPF